MNRHFVMLVVLGALWGASHMFVRIAVPEFGPVALIASRILLAALLLGGIALVTRRSVPSRGQLPFLLLVGVLNTAAPFLLLAHAATQLTASLLAILNATAPIWAALIGAVFLRQSPGARVLVGLALGMTGVALIVGVDQAVRGTAGMFAVGEALVATFCYGLATVLIRERRMALPPFDLAHGSMWAGLLVLLPFVPVSLPHQLPGSGAALAVLALGLLCTGIAYILYFRLVAGMGAAPALTVTFLVPVFGVLWGHLLLDEVLGPHTVLGTGIVLLGTALATGLLRRNRS